MPQIRTSKGMNRFVVEHVLPLSIITTKGLFHRSFNTFRGVWHSSVNGYICQELSNSIPVAGKVYHKLVGWCR